MPSDWLDRIKQTIAVDIGRFQTAGLPPKAIVEKLMDIPELAQALQMRADRRKASLWLPIESAPKDHEFVGWDGHEVWVVMWNDARQAFFDVNDASPIYGLSLWTRHPCDRPLRG